MNFEQPPKMPVSPEEEQGKEDVESVLAKVEDDFSTLQGDLERMETAVECSEIIKKLEGLYDKTLDLSNEIGYQPITGKNKFATPEAISNERKIEPLRTRIHNFLMDVAWEKYEKIRYQKQ